VTTTTTRFSVDTDLCRAAAAGLAGDDGQVYSRLDVDISCCCSISSDLPTDSSFRDFD
jgi:hypothetical protein